MNTIPNEIYCNIYSHMTSIHDVMRIFTLNTQSRDLALDCIEYIDAPNQNIPFAVVDRLNNLRHINANIMVNSFEQIAQLLNKRYLDNLYLLYKEGDVTTIIQNLIVLFNTYCASFFKIKTFTLIMGTQLFFQLSPGATVNFNVNPLNDSSLIETLYLSVNRCLPLSNIVINAIWQTHFIGNLTSLSEITVSTDNFLGLPRVQRRDLLSGLLLNIYNSPNITTFQLDKYDSYENMHTLATSLAPTIHYLSTHRQLTPTSRAIHFHFPLTFSSDLTHISTIFTNLASIVIIAEDDTRLLSFIPFLSSRLQFIILIINNTISQATLRKFYSIVPDIKLLKL